MRLAGLGRGQMIEFGCVSFIAALRVYTMARVWSVVKKTKEKAWPIMKKHAAIIWTVFKEIDSPLYRRLRLYRLREKMRQD